MTPKLALALAAALCAAPAAAVDEVYEYVVDETIPLPADGVAASLSLQAGPVTITEVRVRNRPTEHEVRENPEGLDRSRPKPIVIARNDGKDDVKVSLSASLEGASGQPFMSCRRKTDLDAGETDDWNVCSMEGLYTKDWPKVKFVHVVVRVRPEDPVPGAAADAAKGIADGHAVVVHYYRSDGRFRNWELGVWETVPGTPRPPDKLNRDERLAPTGRDDFGVYWVFKDTQFRSGRVTYMIYRRGTTIDGGDDKEQFGDDKTWSLADGHEVWVNSNQAPVYMSKEEARAAQ